MSARYVAERGSGSHGTSYNLKDWEVLDLERRPSARVVCRASRLDAVMIAEALNTAAMAASEPARAAA